MDHQHAIGSSSARSRSRTFPRAQRELVALSLRVKPPAKPTASLIERDWRNGIGR